ncbi:MAG: hypothetical protein B7X89_10250 [Sulfuricurvum sp. 17-40-25]|nr:MAG: hypothetical protein B7Y30_06785 [Campylobacterales bacterium 16-40-21]OZA02205.1 MAG: hypothetical protein B7X89_10250 [Sulfuricurvum sp. 17-40-25]
MEGKMSKKTKSPMTDLSQSGLTAEQIKLLRENCTEEEIAQMKCKAEELELEEIETILHERLLTNPQKRIPFNIKEYQKYREERIEKEGTFESLEEWRIRMSPENGEEKKEDGNAS